MTPDLSPGPPGVSGLPPHHQMPSVADDRQQRLVRVVPGLIGVVCSLAVLTLTERPMAAVLGALCVTTLGIVVMLPVAVRRAQGVLMVREANRTLLRAREQLEAGQITEARAALEALAGAMVDRLSGYRVVVLQALAYAMMHDGETARALTLLDHLERGGWLEALVMRRLREPLVAGQTIARAQLGDAAGLDRMLARLRPSDVSLEARAARVLAAARRGEPVASALEAILSSEIPAGRTALVRMLRLVRLSVTAPDDPLRAQRVAELRASGQRPFRALKAGWPELYALAEKEGLVGEAGPADEKLH